MSGLRGSATRNNIRNAAIHDGQKPDRLHGEANANYNRCSAGKWRRSGKDNGDHKQREHSPLDFIEEAERHPTHINRNGKCQ